MKVIIKEVKSDIDVSICNSPKLAGFMGYYEVGNHEKGILYYNKIQFYYHGKYILKHSLKFNSIISSECDCPYDMGEYCKHQVAVFHELLKDSISILYLISRVR